MSDLKIPVTIVEVLKSKELVLESLDNQLELLKQLSSEESNCRVLLNGRLDAHEGTFRKFFENSVTEKNKEEKIKDLNYALWVYSFDKMDITKAMTEGAKHQFLENVKKNDIVFCEKEIIGLIQNSNQMFKNSSLETVRTVFNKLIGAEYESGNRYIARKKNNLQKIEQCFRLRNTDAKYYKSWSGNDDYITKEYFSSSSLKDSDSYVSKHVVFIDDIITACRLIEGAGFSDYSNNFDGLCRQARKGQTWVDTEYFNVQVFKNGNVKIRFHDEKLDVLERLNAIGSGRENELGDALKKRYKQEHFSEEENQFDAEEMFKVTEEMVKKEAEEDSQEDKDFSFFETQEKMAKRVIELADFPEILPEDFKILEPSAGNGGILKFVPGINELDRVTAIELQYYRARSLKKDFPIVDVREGNFLSFSFYREKFDRIVMNPPFHKRTEVIHVIKAFSHLKPGGKLVAILPEGWWTRDDLKAVTFRNWLGKYEVKPSEKFENQFKKTKVVTRIIVVQKPFERI